MNVEQLRDVLAEFPGHLQVVIEGRRVGGEVQWKQIVEVDHQAKDYGHSQAVVLLP